MPPDAPTIDEHLVLDGNAVAGVLAAAYGVEVTANRGECRHCGTTSFVGALRAYVGGPGIVLRCPTCGGVVLRVAEISGRTVLEDDGVSLDIER